ncbi:MFS transporter [Bacillus sp. 1P06AnD]|uniref:MFS transporter n=1 Tax=Bacillus sp. 1P06AnD TaxID=3132208 RepID=UPI00399F37E8
MNGLWKDKRFLLLAGANIASAIGSGITMISIPWMLISEKQGNEIYGYVMLAITVISFFVTPIVGKVVDLFSRKKLLMYGELAGILIIGSFVVMGWLGIEYTTWHYIVIIFSGSLYNTLFYPAIFAFIQETFHKDMYKSLNGAMEVQGQFSSMVAGAVGSVLITAWPLDAILLMDAITYGVAFCLLISIPYQKRIVMANRERASLKEGFTFLHKTPILFFFLFASYMPFIGVMVTNYLFPIYLQKVLHAGAWAYGMEGMIYSVGAVAAGLFIPIAIKKYSEEKIMVMGVSCSFLALAAILFSNLPIYLCLMFFIALGNAGTRVARNTYMMKKVPNHIMGRVDSVFRLYGLLVRMMLIALFTKLVSLGIIVLCTVILSCMMLAASISMLMLFGKMEKGIEKEDLHAAVDASS